MGLALTDLAEVFNDEAKAYEKLEAIRWPDGPVCPHCGSTEAHFIEPKDGARLTHTGKETFRRVYRCHNKECRKQFSVLVGTIFGDSHIPLGKWLMAFHLLCSAKNGCSAHELSRQLQITVKSAWFMAHRIRYAMERPPLSNKLQGIVEADETYFGGKSKNMHKAKREQVIQGRGTAGKTPVVTLVERGGEARSRVMHRVTRENIGKVLSEQVSPTAILNTDTGSAYDPADGFVAEHYKVNHGAGEYVRGTAYTNTVEGYFGQLKRSIDGTHHHVSEQHLNRYLAEFDLRYSTRKMQDSDRTVLMIRKTAGKRLTWEKPNYEQPKGF